MRRSNRNQKAAVGYPRVAVTFDVDFHLSMDIFEGIRNEVEARRLKWELIPLPLGFESTLREWVESGRIDGAIGHFVSDSWLQGLPDFPAVNVSQISWVHSVDTVGVDYTLAGRLAAEALTDLNLAAYAFLGIHGQAGSRQLEVAFVEAMSQRGFNVVRMFGRSPVNWEGDLARLPKPLGLFAVQDGLVRAVVEYGRKRGWKIPEEMALLGVGNVAYESVRAGIGISSLALPGKAMGREAVGLLEKRLSGQVGQPVQVWLSPGEILWRESLLRKEGKEDWLVKKALSLIREHPVSVYSVNELAERMGVSRRTLEMRFQASLGETPYGVIQRERMERACALLRQEGMKVHAVAEACGFSSQHAFSTAFRKHHGCSPLKWRSQRLS